MNSNWDTLSYPDSPGASATFPNPTGDLTVDLGEEITVRSLTVNKPTTVGQTANVTFIGSATNKLVFEEGASLVNAINSGTGQTIMAAPVVLNSTLAIGQGDSSSLDFTQEISGAGGMNINRVGTAANGSGRVVLSAANTYGGSTVLTGSTGDDWLVVRLGNAGAIPATNNILMTSSAVLELAAGDFTRALGVNAGQIQFSGAARNGWSALGGDRVVNLGGAFDPVTWSVANFGQLVLGVYGADAMVDFQNPLVLDGTGLRIIRSYDSTTAAIEGRISGAISGTGGINKQSDGVLSLAGANTYSGTTRIQGGMLRLDHADAASPNSNIELGSGATLGIGADTAPADPNADFARNLGTAAGEIRMVAIGGGNNATNSGFSAHGGNRSVVLNGGAALTWGAGSFLQGTGLLKLILSDGSSDSTIDFKNPIDLGSTNRSVVARNGDAVIDARLSGVLSGTAGLVKENPGTLELSAANTYQGITEVQEGALLLTNQFSIPGGVTGGNTANIRITSTNPNNIATIGLGHGSFTSGLGAGAGQFQIIGAGGGGFAAYGAERIVNLGSAGAQITWGSADFLPAGGRLALSAVGADATIDFQNPLELGAGAREVQVRPGMAEIDGVLSGNISGTGGSLVKLGGGTLSLTGANTYDGGTQLNEGRLLVNGTNASGVTVNAGTLGGTGAITGDVTLAAGARLAPGNSSGVLSIFGDTAFDSGSFFDVEIGGGAPGTGYDRLHTDSATLNGTMQVQLINGFSPAPGSLFDLVFSPGGLSGTFANVILPEVPGIEWQVHYNSTSVWLTTSADGLGGDFNGDSVVDAADYVIWRKRGGTQEEYDAWQFNFGATSAGSGTGGESAAPGVPEPAASAILLFALPLLAARGFGGSGR